MKPRERILARLALGTIDGARPVSEQDVMDLAVLDHHDLALVRLGALLALDASTATLAAAVSDATMAGVSPDEIVCHVVRILPTLGAARASVVAPHLALALGFDLDAALEDRYADS